MEAFRRKIDSLQNVINKLMLRLYAKDQDQQLQMCLGFKDCRPAMTTPHGLLQCPDVSSHPPQCDFASAATGKLAGF